MKNPFDLFISLITFDQELYQTEQKIEKLNQEITELMHKKELFANEYEKYQESVQSMRKQVDVKELEMKAFEVQEKELQGKLAIVHNDKEYKALKREIASIHTLQHEYEDVLVDIWQKLETTQKEAKKQAEEQEKKCCAMKQEIAVRKEDIEKLEQHIALACNIRQEKEKSIPDEWLDLYARLRNRVKDPVAQVVEHSCGSCFHRITDKDFLSLKKKKLLQCKGCFRLLYIEMLKESSSTAHETTELDTDGGKT